MKRITDNRYIVVFGPHTGKNNINHLDHKPNDSTFAFNMNKKVQINRIKAFLDEVGLDQKELAQLLKASKNSVSRWCRNESQPSLKYLKRIADLAHIDVRSLLEPSIYASSDGPSAIEVYLNNKAKLKREKAK